MKKFFALVAVVAIYFSIVAYVSHLDEGNYYTDVNNANQYKSLADIENTDPLVTDIPLEDWILLAGGVVAITK